MKLGLLTPFDTIPYFTIEGFKQVTAPEKDENPRVRKLLYRWMKAGHIFQLKKGMYVTRRFYEAHRNDALFSAGYSAIILPQSYVSLEYVLQRFGVLTEITYPITAITPKNTRIIVNKLGTFTYKHIQSQLYHGFTITEYHGIRLGQASLAKALFDYLYLRPLPKTILGVRYNLAEELRLNLDEFSATNRDEFASYVEGSGLVKMDHILKNFRRTVWQP
ncbi:MAG: hypothetical protein MUO64_00405 [Anaerolineales bacterium]|nr:hypothetical protein [Anaerolineales bacterium]